MNYKIVKFDEKYIDPFIDLYISISNVEDYIWTRENARYYLIDLGVKEIEKYSHFAIDDNGKLLGGIFAGTRPFFDKQAIHINCVAVFEKFQKNGIGKGLLNYVVELSKNSKEAFNFITFEIDVLKDHPKKWYENIGFKDTKWSLYYCNIADFKLDNN